MPLRADFCLHLTLKMLCLYLDTFFIGHKRCSMLSTKYLK